MPLIGAFLILSFFVVLFLLELLILFLLELLMIYNGQLPFAAAKL